MMSIVDRVERLLRAKLGENVAGVRFLDAGEWSQCFAFEMPDGEFVVRLGAHVEDFEKDRLAAQLASPDLPVPEFRSLGRADDLWFAVTRRVHGVPLEHLEAAGWDAVVPSLFRALDAMADADLSDRPGWGGWDASGRAPHATWRNHLLAIGDDRPGQRTHGWRHKLAHSPSAERALDAAHRALVAVVDACPDNARGLIHADLINRNTLVEGNTISGIFDWGCSIYGDPLFDLAWLSFWAPWHPGLHEADVVGRWRSWRTARSPPFPSDFDARLRACHLAIGIDHLGYNAFTNRWDELQRLVEYLDLILSGLVARTVTPGRGGRRRGRG